jgi:hypothetical protein
MVLCLCRLLPSCAQHCQHEEQLDIDRPKMVGILVISHGLLPLRFGRWVSLPMLKRYSCQSTDNLSMVLVQEVAAIAEIAGGR